MRAKKTDLVGVGSRFGGMLTVIRHIPRVEHVPARREAP
jgi:hypothetical protein